MQLRLLVQPHRVRTKFYTSMRHNGWDVQLRGPQSSFHARIRHHALHTRSDEFALRASPCRTSSILRRKHACSPLAHHAETSRCSAQRCASNVFLGSHHGSAPRPGSIPANVTLTRCFPASLVGLALVLQLFLSLLYPRPLCSSALTLRSPVGPCKMQV